MLELVFDEFPFVCNIFVGVCFVVGVVVVDDDDDDDDCITASVAYKFGMDRSSSLIIALTTRPRSE